MATATLQTSSGHLTQAEIKTLRGLNKIQSAKLEASFRKILVRKNPFLLIEDDGLLKESEPCLKIKTKRAAIVPFVLNKAQRHIYKIFKTLWDAGKPIRIIVLKARQVGSTTAFMAFIYSIISQSESQAAAVIADEKGKANDIFEMAKLFQERCPVYLRPEIKKSNERKLEFEGIHSQIAIDTAENKDAGRSATLRHVLLSEYAYYRKDNADAIMLGISHSVPSLPHTMIIKETTANGFNHFKDEWDAACAGKNNYTPIFVPWYWDEGYVMPFDEATFMIGDPAYGDETKDEPALAKQLESEGIDLIKERLAWRRWDIRNNCKGDVDKFSQENPSTPEMAFLASGSCFFDQKKLVKQLNKLTPPLFRANILKDNFKWVVRKCSDGDFWFYEEPSPYGQYVIGGDACSGSGTDYAPLVAMNKETKSIAVVYRAKCDPDELAYRAMILGSFLNNAKVAIESDKFGFAANQKLITIYGNVYVKRTYDKIQNKITESFGWQTTALTRPMMLAQMQLEIRNDTLQLKHEDLIRECLCFIKNPESGKAEAESGRNDDLVIACAIALQLLTDDPYHLPAQGERESRRAREHDAMESHNAGMRFSGKK